MAQSLNKQILSSSAVSEGEWTDIGAMAPQLTVIVYGFAAGDIAQIYVSNKTAVPALAVPAAGDGTVKLGSDITADLGVIVDADWRWIRVRKSAAGGTPATTKADLKAMGAYVF